MGLFSRLFARQPSAFGGIVEPIYTDQPKQRRSVASVPLGYSGNVYNRGTLADIISTILPDARKEQLTKCQTYRMEDDFVRTLVDTESDIFTYGMKFALSNRGGQSSRSGKRLEALRDFAEEMRIYRVAKELMKDWVCTGSFVLVWFVPKGSTAISSVIRVDPASVDYVNAFGVDRLSVPMPSELQKLMQSPQKDEILKQLGEAGLSEKYLAAVRRNERMVELSNDDGEYWYVGTDGPPFDGFAQPSMCVAFLDLELRSMLKSGDFSLAYLLKNLKEHVTAGESIDNGPLAGRRNNWATAADLGELQTLLNSREMQLAQIGRYYTNHTVKTSYEFPPLELWNPTKYQEVKERLITWSGICGAILLGKGEYAGSSFGVRRFQNKGKNARREIGDAFRVMFAHQPVMGSLGLRANDKVTVEWNREILEDAKVTLDRVNAAVDRGILDTRTYAETMGWEYDVIMTRKREQLKEFREDQWLFWPAFEQKQGILTNAPGLYGDKVTVVAPLPGKSEPQGPGGKPGRPGNPEGDRTDEGIPANPAPKD